MPEDLFATKSEIAELDKRLERIEQQLESLIGKSPRQEPPTGDTINNDIYRLFDVKYRLAPKAERILARDHLLSNRLTRLWTRHQLSPISNPSTLAVIATFTANFCDMIHESAKKIDDTADSTDVEPKLEEERKK